MPTETPKRYNSTLLDSTVLNALRKYATTARQQGREDRATLALELLSRFDKKAHANIVAQHRKADEELLSALQSYSAAVTTQGRADRIEWANQSFVALHADPFEDLCDSVTAHLSELDAKIAALTPAAKKR